MQYFKQNKHFPDLKEATVRGWKNLYVRELHIHSQGRKRDAPLVQIEVRDHQNVEEGPFLKKVGR